MPFRFLIDLLYPRLCPVCKRSLTAGEKYICSFCLADFPLSDPLLISPLKLLDGITVDCYVNSVYSLFYYDKFSPYRNLIYTLKYRSRKKLGIYLGKMLGEKITGGGIDLIIPVPLHPRKEKKRGFNQSNQIALGISEVLQCPVIQGLVRIKDNSSQTGKNYSERIENVADIFELKNPELLEGKHILLVDDVITTGATICSGAKVLFRIKNVQLSLGCLARTSL